MQKFEVTQGEVTEVKEFSSDGKDLEAEGSKVKPEEKPEGEEVEEPEGEEVPLWLQGDDEEEVEGGDEVVDHEGNSVPVAKHIDLKKKLKGTIREKDDELEKLREENERLKQQQASGVPSRKRPARPDPDKFGTTAEFNLALDAYEDELTKYNTELVKANVTQQANMEKTLASVNQSVDDYYTRAEKLVTESKIKPEVFQQADTKIKQSIEELIPSKGEATFNHLVHLMGDGSEKAMLYLGRNTKALNEFKSILKSDTSGLSAMLYLGKLQQRVNGPVSKTSRAPKPGSELKEQQGTPLKGSKMLERYKEAHKKGNSSMAYNIKKEAKAAGVDTTKW